VAWSGAKLVAVGYGSMSGSPYYYSTNGTSWTGNEIGTGDMVTTITWTGQEFVAAGRSSVLTSSDAWLWTYSRLDSLFPASQSYYIYLPVLQCLTWTGNQLVAVGNTGFILTSADGAYWVNRTEPRPRMNYVLSANAMAVAVGQSGTIITSPDCQSWSKVKSGCSSDLVSVAWTGSRFFIIGGGRSEMALRRQSDKLGLREQNKKGDLLVIRANFAIKRSDFNIMPGQFEDKVSNDIELTLSIAGASPK
jgi:hypothetical protein